MWIYQGKEEEDGQTYWWKGACKIDMTEGGLKENNTTNRTAWMNEIMRDTSDSR